MAKYVPSHIQEGISKCYISGKMYGLDRHHVLHGRGIKPLAEEDGLWIWLDHKLHMDIHDKGYAQIPGFKITDKELQALGQRTFIKDKMRQGYPEDVARDLFRERYGRFYDYE